MTKQERILRLAGTLTVLRDDFETLQFKPIIQQKTHEFLTLANMHMHAITDSGAESNNTLIELSKFIDSCLDKETDMFRMYVVLMGVFIRDMEYTNHNAKVLKAAKSWFKQATKHDPPNFHDEDISKWDKFMKVTVK